MDANGTRFHLLLGRDDWSSCTVDETPLRELWSASPPRPEASPLAWNEERAELTLQPRLFCFTAAPKDVPPTLGNRRGAGRDQYGNWYWIDDSGRELLVHSAGSRRTSHFWQPGDGATCAPDTQYGEFAPKEPPTPLAHVQLSGLAVTEDHYLVVGTLTPPGVLIFDLHAGGPPRQIPWPSTIAFAPFDMAPRPGGGVWILDRDHHCYWELDHQFNVVNPESSDIVLAEARPDDFQPVGTIAERGIPRRTFPSGQSLHVASPLALHDPIAIEALPDGSVLILDRPPSPAAFSIVYHYYFDPRAGAKVVSRTSLDSILELVEVDQRAGFRLLGHDFAVVPHQEPPEAAVTSHHLYVAAGDGNQSFMFALTFSEGQLRLTPVAAYLPMRLFGGKALVAAGKQIYYDFDKIWIPLIEQRRPRYVVEATLTTPTFDGQEPDCVWHRLFLDGCIPPETTVKIESRAADDAHELAVTDWYEEARLYRRGDGAELPFLSRSPALDETDTVTTTEGDGTWELLFQQARGRFLQLRLHVRGNAQTTPLLRALRAYYPRFSYLTHYLPAVYRENAASASFLDRFLANVEGFYTALEDKIAAVQMLFDVRSAPPDTLEWLASWFDVAVDPAWDEARRRLFIGHAMAFLQYRGTICGLHMALRLVFEKCPDETIFTDPLSARSRAGAVRIVETFRARRTPAVVFGDPTEQSGLRLTVAAERWLPAQGRDALDQRYTEALRSAGITQGEQREFPLHPSPAESVVWTTFARAALGFVPSATPNDAPRWHDFLARRYSRIGALNDLYRTQWESFAAVPLPERVPPDGAPLLDWYQFEAVVLAMHRTAHRFSVLLPAPTQVADDSEHRRRLDLAERLIALEKPAHTVFDVKFFWAALRVGEVRLGYDTVLDRGSRALGFPRLVLGQGFLAESVLAPSHPFDVTDRQVAGRDRLGNIPPL
jgi:phage tail-like protein